MSWIKITQYLPGDTRRIQIWNDNDAAWADPKGGNHYGYYMPAANKWHSLTENDKELCHVTHWAELLGEPEDLKKTI